jgi:hypothetical protein
VAGELDTAQGGGPVPPFEAGPAGFRLLRLYDSREKSRTVL